MSENADQPKKNGRHFTKIGPRFGREKPAIPGPGRPRLSDEERSEREILKQGAKLAAARLVDATHSKDERNAIRASEIILSHTVPKLEEVNMHDHRPLAGLPEEVLRQLAAGPAPAPHSNGENGNGVSA